MDHLLEREEAGPPVSEMGMLSLPPLGCSSVLWVPAPRLSPGREESKWEPFPGLPPLPLPASEGRPSPSCRSKPAPGRPRVSCSTNAISQVPPAQSCHAAGAEEQMSPSLLAQPCLLLGPVFVPLQPVAAGGMAQPPPALDSTVRAARRESVLRTVQSEGRLCKGKRTPACQRGWRQVIMGEHGYGGPIASPGLRQWGWHHQAATSKGYTDEYRGSRPRGTTQARRLP